MAKYEVTYACGHTETVQLYGKESDRQHKIEWYGTILCPACKLKEAEASGLPQLTGSDKQVSWALSIRDSQMAVLKQWVKSVTKPGEEGMARQIITAAWAKTSAAWWIDHRTDSAATLARAIIKA